MNVIPNLFPKIFSLGEGGAQDPFGPAGEGQVAQRHGSAGGADQILYLAPQIFHFASKRGQNIKSLTLSHFDDPQQEVLGAYKAVAQTASFVLGVFKNMANQPGKIFFHGNSAPCGEFNLMASGGCINRGLRNYDALIQVQCAVRRSGQSSTMGNDQEGLPMIRF